MTQHLWQSSLFALVAVALAFLLRKNRAAVRYWIWLAASLKFLVPFAILVDVGRQMPAPAIPVATIAASPAAIALDSAFLLPSAAQSELPWRYALMAAWLIGSLAVILSWIFRSRRMRTSASVEPGVFGIFRPQLILPDGIVDRLTPDQLRAIVAHETCHIRRRDNLFAAIHMLVEALFWFHPLVWWIGARLIDERERACDEEVLRQGADPHAYASGILEVCKFCLESPLACVSGVTGADLKRRVATILAGPVVHRLTLAHKALLAATAAAVVCIPLLLGVVRAQVLVFEVASVKSSPDSPNSTLRALPGGGLTAVHVTLRALIGAAFHLRDDQIIGGPPWMSSDAFDIEAKGGADGSETTRQKLKALLADRFRLQTHEDTRESDIFELVPARSGLKIRAVERDRKEGDGGFSWGRGRVISRLAPLSEFASILSGAAGRPVLDRTGSPGNFDFTLLWTPENYRAPDAGSVNPREPLPDSDGPGLFTALQEQLGLRLNPARGPIPILVIDSAQKPSEN